MNEQQKIVARRKRAAERSRQRRLREERGLTPVQRPTSSAKSRVTITRSSGNFHPPASA